MSDHVVAVFVSEQGEKPQLANQLEEQGLTVLRSTSSEQLCRDVNTHRVDAVVVEQHLGGFLTGLEILQRLREQLLRPILVVIGDLDASERSAAAELRIDLICPWEMGVDSICKSIFDLMGYARHSGFLIPAAARQLVAESEHIGVIPQLVVQLTKYLHDDDAKVGDLAKDISSDPSVTGELMRLINSAAFGLQVQVTDVKAAVKYLGIRRTVSLVLELSFHAIRRSLHQQIPADLMNWFGLRSVVNACVASSFATRRKDVSADAVYVLALLQDIGILVLSQAYRDRYTHLLSQVRNVAQLQLDLIEKSEFSFTHAHVSAALLQQWEFPASMIQLVLEHHASPENLSDPDQKFLHLMQLGESVANLRDVPSPQRHMRLEKCLAQSRATSALDAKSCIASAIQHSRDVTSYFDLAVPENDNWWNLIEKLQQELNGSPVNTAENASENAPENAPNPPTPLEAAAPKTDSPPVIVVIDDEPAIGKMLKVILKDHPLEVECHETPPPTSELGSHVKAILCDVHLKEKNGIDFVRKLRAEGFGRPIIMISGDRTRDTVLSSISAGIVDYIAKPFTKDSVLKKFEKHGLLEPQDSPQTATSSE